MKLISDPKEAFSGFAGLSPKDSSYESSMFVVVPVPFDKTSTWVKGADKGPTSLIEASQNMELYDIETDTEVCRKGIFTDRPIVKSAPEAMVEAVKQTTLKHLSKGKAVIILGGEHSVTTGAVYAYKEKYPKLNVLQIDAHTDLRERYEGSRFNHACVMARVKDICPIVQVGIRSVSSEENHSIDRSRCFLAEDIQKDPAWMGKALAKLESPVYITIDLDGFDPSLLPSTGTPEPGGLKWYETLEFLKNVIKKKKVVGFDVVELCPNPSDKSSDFLAAKLVYKLMSYIAL